MQGHGDEVDEGLGGLGVGVGCREIYWRRGNMGVVVSILAAAAITRPSVVAGTHPSLSERPPPRSATSVDRVKCESGFKSGRDEARRQVSDPLSPTHTHYRLPLYPLSPSRPPIVACRPEWPTGSYHFRIWSAHRRLTPQ